MSDMQQSGGNAMAQHAPITTTISELSDDLLCKIFLLVPQKNRLDAVPGTCRRWNSLLARPDMWRQFSCCRHIVNWDDASQLLALRWLQRRTSEMTSFHIELPGYDEIGKIRWDDGEIRTILLAMSLAPKLKQLSIHMRKRTGMRSGTLAHVQLFTGLTSLACDGIYNRVGSGHLSQLFTGLPALESCSLHFRSTATPGSDLSHIESSGDEFPDTLLQCTRLTSLVVTVPRHMPKGVLDWGGLPQNITVLWQLAQLRLYNCLSKPVTEALSAITSLTNLGLCCYDDAFYANGMLSGPVFPASAAVTSLRCVDITGASIPRALRLLTGLQDLTLWNIQYCSELWLLGSCTQLSRLRLESCDILHGNCVSGLDNCTALVSLQIVNCEAVQLAPAPWHSQLTQLCLADYRFEDAQLVSLLQAAQQLVLLDICGNPSLALQSADVLASLQRCTRLRKVRVETFGCRQELRNADAIWQLQRALPSVRFHPDGGSSRCFDGAAAKPSIGCQEGYYGPGVGSSTAWQSSVGDWYWRT